jgi:hypothetical protein
MVPFQILSEAKPGWSGNERSAEINNTYLGTELNEQQIDKYEATHC